MVKTIDHPVAADVLETTLSVGQLDSVVSPEVAEDVNDTVPVADDADNNSSDADADLVSSSDSDSDVSDSEAKDPPTKERIHRVDQVYSKSKRKYLYKATPPSDDKNDRASHVVLKVRRIIDDKGFPSSTEIDIKSALLRECLEDIFADVGGLQLNQSPPIATPELLFHARVGLAERLKAEEAKETPNKTLIDEVNVALQYIAEDATTQATLNSLSEHDEITFDLLWAILPPNTAVYTKTNLLREDQILKLQGCRYEKTQTGKKVFCVDILYLTHDGEQFGWGTIHTDIDQFDGARKVSSLPGVPLERLPETDEVSTGLKARGKVYMELLGAPRGTCKEYSGAAVTENRMVVVNNEYKKVCVHISGRIMVDTNMFLQPNEYTDLLQPPIQIELKPSEMNEDDLIFCNHCIGGFGFRQKKWCLFAMSRFQPVVWDHDAFSKLVMDTTKRDLIHSLVKSHRNGTETFDDVVSGKGKGLVGLLSGNPGVGKTLTAEVISEVTERPLYMLSAGELGTRVADMEHNLDMVLEVTKQWGCVLLIDEADVFLQARDGFDVERNAMVSVFLRRLEYFQGVLIMTTNRQRTIDPAFDSRIHFQLHYGDLSPDSRFKVWKNCLSNAPKDLPVGKVMDQHLEHLSHFRLNGRQIKNAMACAISIAVEDKTELSLEKIETMLEMAVEQDEQRGMFL